MSEINYNYISQNSISTPTAGVGAQFLDLDKNAKVKTDAGYVKSYVQNFSIANQTPTAAARTYLIGSSLPIGSGGLQVGSMMRWRFSMTKTAAGIATSTVDICFGTLGTTADTARVSFTKPAGTAAADDGWVEVVCVIRSIGASGVAVGEFILSHTGNTVGHAINPVTTLNTVSAGFSTLTPTFVGLCITTGASDAITIQMVTAEGWNI